METSCKIEKQCGQENFQLAGLFGNIPIVVCVERRWLVNNKMFVIVIRRSMSKTAIHATSLLLAFPIPFHRF